MNPWDLLTWISAVALGVSGILIFVYFLRDARDYIEKEKQRKDSRSDQGPRSDH